MSNIVLIDGFDLYNGLGANLGLTSKYTATASLRLSLGAGRFGGQCVVNGSQNNAGITSQIYRSLPANYSAVGVGVAFQAQSMSNMSASPLNNMLLQLSDSAGVFQVGLGLSPDGTLTAYRLTGANAGTALGSTVPGIILSDTWHYLQWEVAISDTVGTVLLKVDGATVLNLSAQDTRNGTPTTVNRLYLSQALVATVINANFKFDDLYVTDGATVGEARVDVLVPDSDVAVAFAPSTGASNYALVDEMPVNSGDYVTGAAVGDTDTYGFSNPASIPAAVYAIQLTAFAFKTDASSRSLALQVKSGATTDDGPAFVLSGSLNRYSRILQVDPNTSAPWTAASLNALQGGPKVAA